MNKKIVTIDLDNISKFILKQPRAKQHNSSSKSSSNSSSNSSSSSNSKSESKMESEYIGEIWYLDDGKLYLPIIQPPRLKVKYGAKIYQNGIIYSYCVNMYNYDIDPEINAFCEFIRAYDKHIVSLFRTHREQWKLKNIKNKYLTAMKRKDNTSDPFMTIKLLQDKDGGILTSINDISRNRLAPTDIIYGTYLDQYIGPSCVVFNDTGIYPIWQAHQIIVNKIERVFLEHCLLDEITTQRPSSDPCRDDCILAATTSAAPNLGSKSHHVDKNTNMRGSVFGAVVQEKELLSAIMNLRKTTANQKPSHSSISLITAEDLQKKRHEISTQNDVCLVEDKSKNDEHKNTTL
jgi:hypothetical protein